MKKWKVYGGIALLLIVSWSACNRMAGVYVANHGEGTDTLRIFSNHTYVRICYPTNDSLHYNDTGTWKIDDDRIWFENWYGRNEFNHSYEGKPFLWGAYLDRPFFIGRIRLPISYDMGYYYIKQ